MSLLVAGGTAFGGSHDPGAASFGGTPSPASPNPVRSPAPAASTPGAYGRLPVESGAPAFGGTLSIAEAPGAGPAYIFPVTPAADSSVYTTYQFDYYMWRPLWWSPRGDEATVDYRQSMAGPPVFSNRNKTVTIHLRRWKWSDGTPVTSTDLAFDYWLVKAAVAINPSNDGDFTPGLYPDNVRSVATPSPTTFVIHFNRSYNASFEFLAQLAGAPLIPLPAQAWARRSTTGRIIPFRNMRNAKAIYRFLAAQSERPETYATNPLWQVVDGPYRIASFNAATGANALVANRSYSGPVTPHIARIADVAFRSTSAEFAQLLAGKLDFGYVDGSDLAQVGLLESRGYNVWGYPDMGFSYIAYNFHDPTGDFDRIIGQLYIRQALAHLQDERAVIHDKATFDGAAAPAFDAVPVIPKTPFTPRDALANPYPSSVREARDILRSHGWKVVPGGTTTCRDAGTAAHQCGAGIPAGTALSWDLVYSSSPSVIGSQDAAWATHAKQVGIEIKLVPGTFNYILGRLSDVLDPANEKLWAMEDFGGFADDLYPTTSELFDTTGPYNQGGFSSDRLDRASAASQFSLGKGALAAELALVADQQPGLFQPVPDLVYAIKDTLSGPPASFEDASQYRYSPEYWYFKARTATAAAA